MWKWLEEEISFNVRTCQQPSNVVDCEVYAVVNIVHVSLGHIFLRTMIRNKTEKQRERFSIK